MPKRRSFYKGLSVYCGGPHGDVKQSHESQQDQETAHDTGLYAAEKCAYKWTASSNIRRLRLCEPVRCTRKRWASGTSHLAVVNSRCAHGLQEPFSAQPKAMSRLARNNRSRLESSISFIL